MRRGATGGVHRRSRGFSVIELLVALTISATLLTATMAALDAMFKGFQQTTDSASTHVVARIAVNRLLGMVRTGDEFGPIPVDVLDAAQNPLAADYFEYVSARDESGNATEATRIEFRFPGQEALLRTWTPGEEPEPPEFEVTGPGDLWIVLVDLASGEEEEYILLPGVRSAEFTLQYDIGPRLMRATIDLVVEPQVQDDIEVTTGAIPATFRLVASAMPRKSVE